MSLPADHPRLKKRPFTAPELLADGIVHAVALIAGLLAFSILLAQVLWRQETDLFVALVIYAAGYFLMFGFSLAYNMIPPSPLKWVVRRFDHSSIFVMIAGTYTALVVHFESRVWVLVLLAIVWSGAALGAAVKIALPGKFDRLSILAYIALGAVGLAAIGPAMHALPSPSLILVGLGGLTYVAGVFFYRWHSLHFHNALWHLFVAVAAGLHFAAVSVAAAV
ncbi:PAQR family membrane homeostasis protein TrhA [Phaeovulum vinaykumarii]|uniref:Hemolysin III n=1 Tax=Phaeovulum vinaykumarii TaxID=407234 RepID=A0A1N7JUL3_9RHOB|nr:hemolysin III family protein [Phaeovulum vinaykumarii]SIS53015.1 hemolysin III [Phaeovulum vinaykumarii]SOB91465.1 channel protein (hemolysin III family) [Phaeovulum vinaykumarii]